MVLVLAYTLTIFNILLFSVHYRTRYLQSATQTLIHYEIAICYLVPLGVISQVTTRLETFYTEEEDHTKGPTNP